MKILNGAELAGFIKARQAQQVRALSPLLKMSPKLAIIRTNPHPVVDMYMALKQRYGSDIGVLVDVHNVAQQGATKLIQKLNADPSVHGIIVQLPLPDPTETTTVLDSVVPAKDVDGLHSQPMLDAATPTSINWLLAGYNVELRGKHIVIVGQGRLVGRPLARMWRESGLEVETADRATSNLAEAVVRADIVVTATGQPGLITSSMLKQGAVVVDAGVATDKNGLVGDLSPEVRQRDDLTITPEKGGVGPLTVCALFDNVIRAAQQMMSS
jgi:methylenetetrahydrofolate dehydrogenase (NADP+) / methenyltetrahydrofolate cyclohydrolase